MERIPYPSHTLIQAPHHSSTLDPPQLLPISIPQQFSFLQYLLFLQIPHTYHFLPSVDILAANDGVVMRSWRDVDLYLGMRASEGGEDGGFEELAVGVV
jgi:hypothetical protein